METAHEFVSAISDPDFWAKCPKPVRILWSGLTGKLGRTALKVARSRSDVEIIGGLTRCSDAGLIDPEAFSGLEWCQYDEAKLLFRDFSSFDIVVDFSHPDQLELVARFASMMRKPLICGTSGLTEPHLATLRKYTEFIPIFRSRICEFKVKEFIDSAVKEAKFSLIKQSQPAELTLYENFYKGGRPFSETCIVLQERIRAATGYTIGVKSSATFASDSFIYDWWIGRAHCRVAGLDDLANNIFDIAKVMAEKPLKAPGIPGPTGFYDLDELWPALHPD